MTTIYLVQAEHPSVPSNPISAHATQPLADAAARALVNIIRQDSLYDPVTAEYSLILPQLEGEFDWQEALREWQRAKIADDYEPADIAGMDDDGLAEATEATVWINEIELELPQLPVLETVLKAGEDALIALTYADGGDDQAGENLRNALQMMRFAALTAFYVPTVGCDDPELMRELNNARYPEDMPLIIHESSPCEAWSRSPVRVAINITGGAFQWALADGPGVRVQIVDFDVEGHTDFDLTLVTDASGDTSPANVFDAGAEIDPLYLARLDTSPTGVNGLGDVYGDHDEDQEADDGKWLVSADIGVPGPAGGMDNYSGWVPADDADGATKLATTIMERRFPEGTRIFAMRAHRPAREAS